MEPVALGLSEMEPAALGSGEKELATKGSGETEPAASRSGETEPAPRGRVRRSPPSGAGRGGARNLGVKRWLKLCSTIESSSLILVN